MSTLREGSMGLALKEMIFRRKSIRSYREEPVEEEILRKIRDFTAELIPLYPHIKVRSEIVSRDRVRCFLPWVTPQLIAIYSEDQDNALENVGFLFQQLDLYMQSIGLGTCWLGMGRMDEMSLTEPEGEEGLTFVMLMTFGYPKALAPRTSMAEFKRKPLSSISDQLDERLEPARLAPPSVNSQPWYFTHEEGTSHAFCTAPGLLKPKGLHAMNRIDMGIALAHLYVANRDTFHFFKADRVKIPKGYLYIGSFTL